MCVLTLLAHFLCPLYLPTVLACDVGMIFMVCADTVCATCTGEGDERRPHRSLAYAATNPAAVASAEDRFRHHCAVPGSPHCGHFVFISVVLTLVVRILVVLIAVGLSMLYRRPAAAAFEHMALHGTHTA